MHLTSLNKRLTIWLIGVSFVLLQFFLQLSSGIVIDTIMNEMHLSALTAGLLSSALYLIYTALQIPAGLLFDRKNSRIILSTSAAVLSVGCWIFAHSYSLPALFIGRFLIGLGASFAFVGLAHLLRLYFPTKQFAFMIGVSETLGFIATVIVLINMQSLLFNWGWRGFIHASSVIGAVIALSCWFYIPNDRPAGVIANYKAQIWQIIKNKKSWINGLFVGLGFTVVTVFGSLWAIPFLQLKLNCSLSQASFQTGLFFLGAALSCPLFGILAIRLTKRKNLILLSCFSTAFLLIGVLYFPIKELWVMGIMMFIIGTCCGAYMLAYTISNEIAPKGALSTSTGFTNTLAMITAPVLQPVIGYTLDKLSSTTVNGYAIPSLLAYQKALLIVPISLLIAGFLVFYLPEKEQDERNKKIMQKKVRNNDNTSDITNINREEIAANDPIIL